MRSKDPSPPWQQHMEQHDEVAHRVITHWHHRPHHRPRFLFFCLIFIFGFMTLLVTGALTILGYLLNLIFGHGRDGALLVWAGACGLALAMPALAGAVGRRAYRQIAKPLADVMAAADTVTEGDFSARVPTEKPGEFGQLAHSFNRMAEALEHADQQRRNLTADIAHELRTPVHILQGNLEGILDGIYDPTPEHIEAMLDETQQLARLVEDLRTLSLAETGDLPLQMEPVTVTELLEDVETSFSAVVEVVGISLHTHLNGFPPHTTILGDEGRLNQVLSNLVVNAICHTPEGGTITLAAQAQPQKISLLVTDTGEGIPTDDLPYIFDRFWRGDRARTHTSGAGGGLGLAIAKQLIKEHQGDIAVASQLGKGTTFTIQLPHPNQNTILPAL